MLRLEAANCIFAIDAALAGGVKPRGAIQQATPRYTKRQFTLVSQGVRRTLLFGRDIAMTPRCKPASSNGFGQLL
jgi:hypothetical protein